MSCNTAFAKLGVTVGGDALHSMANSYGFNNSHLTIPLPVTASAYPALTDRAQIALSAIGQFNDTETPLQEAMVAAAIANHGTMMRPYLVSQVKAPDQSTVADRPAGRIRQPDLGGAGRIPDGDDEERHARSERHRLPDRWTSGDQHPDRWQDGNGTERREQLSP